MTIRRPDGLPTHHESLEAVLARALAEVDLCKRYLDGLHPEYCHALDILLDHTHTAAWPPSNLAFETLTSLNGVSSFAARLLRALVASCPIREVIGAIDAATNESLDTVEADREVCLSLWQLELQYTERRLRRTADDLQWLTGFVNLATEMIVSRTDEVGSSTFNGEPDLQAVTNLEHEVAHLQRIAAVYEHYLENYGKWLLEPMR